MTKGIIIIATFTFNASRPSTITNSGKTFLSDVEDIDFDSAILMTFQSYKYPGDFFVTFPEITRDIDPEFLILDLATRLTDGDVCVVCVFYRRNFENPTSRI